MRHIPGKLLVVWDGAMIHRSKMIKQFLAEAAAARMHLERFPGYAPELDPEEGIWCHLKRAEMQNLCCREIPELRPTLYCTRPHSGPRRSDAGTTRLCGPFREAAPPNFDLLSGPHAVVSARSMGGHT